MSVRFPWLGRWPLVATVVLLVIGALAWSNHWLPAAKRLAASCATGTAPHEEKEKDMYS